jgi:hypothetical protein
MLEKLRQVMEASEVAGREEMARWSDDEVRALSREIGDGSEGLALLGMTLWSWVSGMIETEEMARDFPEEETR